MHPFACMPTVRTPEASQNARQRRLLGFCLPPSGTRSATPTTIDFGAIFPFTAVPAYKLPVYASQWPLPDFQSDGAIRRAPGREGKSGGRGRRFVFAAFLFCER